MPNTSPNDAALLAGSSNTLTDSAGNTWAISATNIVLENGQPAGYSANVAELAYVNGTIQQENSSGQWWSWNGSGWPGAGTSAWPLPISEGINLDSNGQLAVVPIGTPGVQTVNGDIFDVTAPGHVIAYLGSGSQSLTFMASPADSVTIFGGAGVDTIYGAAESNLIVAGGGTMTVTGGSGASSYYLGQTGGTLQISDFSTAKGDALYADPTLNNYADKVLSTAAGLQFTFVPGGKIVLENQGFVGAPGVHFT